MLRRVAGALAAAAAAAVFYLAGANITTCPAGILSEVCMTIAEQTTPAD